MESRRDRISSQPSPRPPAPSPVIGVFMFTGIVQTIGTVISSAASAEGMQLSINARDIDFSQVKIGDSIAVNGVCLTVTRRSSSSGIFSADASHETVRLTNLKSFKPGTRVHLEQAMASGGRFDGHIVSGHVDGTATVESVRRVGNSTDYLLLVPSELRKYVAPKGSVALDGVSLTVNGISDTGVMRLTIIPHTIEATCIGSWEPGYQANMEVDILARYMERLMGFGSQKPEESEGLTARTLMENGFI